MVLALKIIVVLISLSFRTVAGQTPKEESRQAGHVLPAILSVDQSLPSNGALPMDAIPIDMMAGGVNQGQRQAVSIVNNNMDFVGSKAPMNRNIPPSNSLSGQTGYPSAMPRVNPMQPNNLQNLNLPPEGVPRVPLNGMNYQPEGVQPNPSTNLYYQQLASEMSANMVLRNIQLACSTLQNFVLGTPLAREIMAGVSNMNNMAEIFNSPKQCGIPALSTTLKVFLKTCNLYSSCSNPVRGPSPTPIQQMSSDLPYQVQQQMGPTFNPQVAVQQPQPESRPPETLQFLKQQYQAFQTQIMRMFQWLQRNFRFPQQTTNVSGQQKTANNTTSVPFDD